MDDRSLISFDILWDTFVIWTVRSVILALYHLVLVLNKNVLPEVFMDSKYIKLVMCDFLVKLKGTHNSDGY